MERYKRRRNLRIKDMKEHDNEDTQKEVNLLLAEIIPHLVQKLEDVVDSMHRVGRRESGRHCQIIVQFTMRRYKDVIWKTTKNSQVCIEQEIRFAEDLTAEDRAARAALWTLIQLEVLVKRTFYCSPFGYIKGRLISSATKNLD